MKAPFWLRSLVRVLPRDVRDEILRELLEQRAQVSRQGRLVAWRWAWRQPRAILAWRESAAPRAWISGLRDDWRIASRSLRQRPALAVTVVATVAVSVAAIAGVASIVDAVLLRPLPYPHADRLVWLATHQPGPTSPPFDPARAASAHGNPLDVVDWARRERLLTTLTPFETFEGTIIAGGRPVRVGMASMWATVSEVLGIRAQHGRLFSKDDYAEHARVMVLSHRLWRTAFGADPSLVNQTVDLGGVRYQVVGVLPDFPVSFPTADTDVWFPLRPPGPEFQNRSGVWQRVVARLDPGVTLAQAGEDMARVARELEAEYPKSNSDRRVFVVPYRDGVVGAARSVISLLAGAVALVLVIGCANVGHLLLVSAQGRQRELAVRAALGARPGVVARLLLVESAWLTGLGGVAGLLLAPWALRGFLGLYPESLPSVGEVAINWTAMLAAVVATAVAALLAVLPPLMAARARQLQDTIRAGERGAEHRGQRRTRAALVVTQVALSTALLIGGGLLMRTFLAIRSTDPGFSAPGVLTFNLALSPATYPALADEVRFYAQLLARVRAMPGVDAAGATTLLPFTPGEFGDGFYRVGFNDVAPNIPIARLQNVTPGYFEAVGLPIMRGRVFTAADSASSAPVVVVNEALERRDFPEGAIGRQIRFRGVVFDVVGVVGDKRHRNLREVPRAEMYYPRSQVDNPRYFSWVAIRASRDPLTLVAEIRAVVSRLDPAVAIDKVDTLQHRVEAVIAPDRFRASTVGLLALTALLLAGLGLYGLVAHAVARDSRNIAIRMALGATGAATVGRVVRRVLALTATGVAIGGALAWAGSTLVIGCLAGVAPVDPLTLAVVAALLITIAVVAATGPAIRASRVDPAQALRSQ